jgi:prepilin-type N-terminal cleavage/methylation domain-containing protein
MTRMRNNAFTLIELLVVISIITILTSMLTPALSAAKGLARASQCQANLHDLGVAMSVYHAENNLKFWPYLLPDWPRAGVRCYFWGTDADPVDADPSPFMKACGGNRGYLLCPDLAWGSYTPQGAYVSEPTTTYGYNGRYLDPTLNGKTCRKASDIPRPTELFIFADTAMSWSPGGVTIFQNSSYLEPPKGTWVATPTNHFRHQRRTDAVCADGHAGAFGPEGGSVNAATKLGFVGVANSPHYEQ